MYASNLDFCIFVLGVTAAEMPKTLVLSSFLLLNHLRFTRCELCYHLSTQLNSRDISMETKLGTVKQYREHLHSQYVDRSIQWSLNELSRDVTSGTLIILVDGMDQGKFRIPKHPGLRAVSSMLLGSPWRFCSAVFHSDLF